ncbi:phosphatase PAP2 family protein [Methylibium rhizosphaerae]|uniref:phosphatase PAP2 family protein n=1 Tax=Methylibium rhizosphaerae TaxID=2570323 RepID=UPI00112D130C|nr:phosphatase PAP2 family protein [Methylibium rhizosphaerae]
MVMFLTPGPIPGRRRLGYTAFDSSPGSVSEELLTKAIEEAAKRLPPGWPWYQKNKQPLQTNYSQIIAAFKITPAPAAGGELRKLAPEVLVLLCRQELLQSLRTTSSTSGGKTTAKTSSVAGSGACICSLESPASMLDAEASDVVTRKSDRQSRQGEILAQVSAIDAFIGSVLGMTPDSHPWTVLLMQVVADAIAGPVHALKAALHIQRPAELNAKVMPLIAVPGHRSFPAGHAAYAFALALILPTVVNRSEAFQDLLNLALGVADNRVVAGLHYPVDGLGGLAIALSFATWAIGLGSGSTQFLFLRTEGAVQGQVDPVYDVTVTLQRAQGLTGEEAPLWGDLLTLASYEWL